jgi:hypothetical protein
MFAYLSAFGASGHGGGVQMFLSFLGALAAIVGADKNELPLEFSQTAVTDFGLGTEWIDSGDYSDYWDSSDR